MGIIAWTCLSEKVWVVRNKNWFIFYSPSTNITTEVQWYSVSLSPTILLFESLSCNKQAFKVLLSNGYAHLCRTAKAFNTKLPVKVLVDQNWWKRTNVLDYKCGPAFMLHFLPFVLFISVVKWVRYLTPMQACVVAASSNQMRGSSFFQLEWHFVVLFETDVVLNTIRQKNVNFSREVVS